jgi:hypothetical protein
MPLGRSHGPRDYGQVVEIIFTAFTSSIAFGLVEPALFGLDVSFEAAISVVLVAFSCHVVPVTSTLCPTCASRLSPFSAYDVPAAIGAIVPIVGVLVAPAADGAVPGASTAFVST